MPEQGRDGTTLTIKPEAKLSPIELRLLGLLEKRRGLDGGRHKIRAQDIAVELGVGEGRTVEFKKRAIRKLIRSMRDKSIPISSNLTGYWMAVESADFQAYHKFLRLNGLSHLATAGRSKRSAKCKEAAGQQALF